MHMHGDNSGTYVLVEISTISWSFRVYTHEIKLTINTEER
jgi:hypothetical protein